MYDLVENIFPYMNWDLFKHVKTKMDHVITIIRTNSALISVKLQQNDLCNDICVDI